MYIYFLMKNSWVVLHSIIITTPSEPECIMHASKWPCNKDYNTGQDNASATLCILVIN